MASMLTEEQMKELTKAKTFKGQIQVLRENNILHIVRKDGSPVTTWYNVNHPIHLRNVEAEDEQPDFDAI